MPNESVFTSAPDAAPPTAEDVKADLDMARQEIGAAADAVRSEAMVHAETLKGVATEQVNTLVSRAKSFAGERKDDFASQLEGVSDAVSKAANDLAQQEETNPAAGYARTIAAGMRDLSQTVRRNDVDSLVNLAQDFGRRQPAALLGLAAIAGFAASRFLMASAERRNAEAMEAQDMNGGEMNPDTTTDMSSGARSDGSGRPMEQASPINDAEEVFE